MSGDEWPITEVIPDDRERTDEERVLLGVPVERESGPTPGAVATLRAELRKAASNLPGVAANLRNTRDHMTALVTEQTIWRTSCDELIDAIERLQGETP